MNFLNIFEDHVAGIFGATRAPFSFKKLAKQAARDMEDQTLVINGVNTAPALYTILIAADDDPMLAPFYPELSREVREFVKAQAEKRRYVFVGEPLVRFMIDPQLRAGKFSVFAENVDAPTLGRLYEEERAYQNGLGQNNSAASRAASAPRAGKQQFAAPQQQHPAAMPQQPSPRAAAPDPLAVADPFAPSVPDPAAAPSPCRRPSLVTPSPAWAEPPRPAPPWALAPRPVLPPTWRAPAPRSARSPSSSTS